MLRIWGKIKARNGQLLQDAVVESSNTQLPMYERLDICLDEFSRIFDLAKPIWLDTNDQELNKYGKTTFRQDHFIENISFYEFEIEIIENDET